MSALTHRSAVWLCNAKADKRGNEEGSTNGNFHNINVNQDEPIQNKVVDYSIEEVPPWYISLLLGIQHYLTMFGSTLTVPFMLAPALCMEPDLLAKSEIIGTTFFVSGIATLLQTIVGSRLPIVQGSTLSYLVPTLAILALPKWQCPPIGCQGNDTLINGSCIEVGSAEHREVWYARMREIQGAIMVASLLEFFLGFSGLIGIMMRFIGPLTTAPTIALIGISMFQGAANFCAKQWWIAVLTMILVTVFSQYLANVKIPCLAFSRSEKRFNRTPGVPLFRLFPVILAIGVSWFICYILTITNVFPKDPKAWGYEARTDLQDDVTLKAPWFRFPYPGQWGLPTVSAAAVVGMIPGVLASTIESVGDYLACAEVSGAPPPPVHAINRGIAMEGLSTVLAGALGSGNGTTSYSNNIGAISITKVGSRRVIQVAGMLMIIFSVLLKFSAVFATVPHPVIGGTFMVLYGLIVAVGVSQLQMVDMNSSRNIFIFGFSLFLGISIPEWVRTNPDSINTGNESVNQLFLVLLRTSMFMGGATAFLLDNTIPGTKKERGMDLDLTSLIKSRPGMCSIECYDFPFGMGVLRKARWTRWLPFSPTFVLRGSKTSDVTSSVGEQRKEDFHEGDTKL